MEASVFYQSQRQDACLLKLIPVSLWKKGALPNKDRLLATAQGFEAKVGELVYFHNEENTEIITIWVGAGQEEHELALATVATKLPPAAYRLDEPVSERALLMWSLAQYRFDRYKKNTTQPRKLCLADDLQSKILKEANAIFLVRDLIDTPAQDMDPKRLADAAQQVSKQFGAECTTIEGEELETQYPAIYAVGRAAKVPPRLICLSWGDISHPKLALVGKGVCFDTGGLNIKNAFGMRIMKKDMGGAAIALGLAQWIMAEKLPVRLTLFIAAVENAIGSDAYRPGDILKMRNHLTVEIENTDAEGRLVLADALSRACDDKPDLLIDFATLTGAGRIALGTDISALFCNDDELAGNLLKASEETKDPIWRLPLYAPYIHLLDSHVADLMNSCTTSYAGAITAALFLQKFVDSKVSWAHFDMMAWNPSNKPGRPEGGEAMALRAVAHYVKHWCRS